MPKVFFCVMCGAELDVHDVDTNLTTWGVFKAVCSDDIEFFSEDEN